MENTLRCQQGFESHALRIEGRSVQRRSSCSREHRAAKAKCTYLNDWTICFDATRVAFLFSSWNNMKIVRGQQDMEANARKMIAQKDIYVAASKATNVPWSMIAVIDMREGGIEH